MSQNRRPSASLVWIAGVAFAACGGSTDTSNFAGASSGGGTVTADVACADYTSALCKKLDACAKLLLEIGFGDAETCATRLGLGCPSIFDAAGTTSTPDHLDACAKAVSSVSCDDLFNHVVPAACEATPGKLADGTPCGDDGQCVHAYCKKAQGGTCGACSSHVELGAACSSGFLAGNDCDVGLVCFNEKCAAPVAANGSCDATHPCGAGLYCATGTCTAFLAAGAACDPMTGKDACNRIQGEICDPGSKTCVELGTAKAGEACGAVNGKPVVCVGGATCTVDLPMTGTCTAPAGDGHACDATNGPKCMPPAGCIGGVCTLPDASVCK